MNPFASLFVPDDLVAALSDRAWLAALLDVERALAAASAQAGATPDEAAAAIGDACDVDLFDAEQLAEQGRASGSPVIPLVHELRARVGPGYDEYVHRGATSQDILDSAAMLVARDGLRVIDAELWGAAERCAVLADEHRMTVMAARPFLQQSVPTTFGFKAAGWLVGLVETRTRLQDLEANLPAQLGGAAGTLAVLGADAPEVARLFAAELGLEEPAMPWHTVRTPITALAGALAAAAGACAKIARDVVLLAQSEVAEVAEGERGRAPAAAVLAIACERHARANAMVLFESAAAEHERAAGAWHAEWHGLTTALAATGGAAASVRRSLESLEVDGERMRANLADSTLDEARALGLDAERPEDYLGQAGASIDRALELYRNR